MKILFSSILIFTFTLSIYLIPSYAKDSTSSLNVKHAKKLYYNECSKCHRKNGKGVKRVYPPLKDADYVQNNSTDDLLRGILFGRSGTIEVNGWEYNGVMTTEVDKSLKDSEIAMILTYVYQELNKMDKKVTAKDVKKARKLGPLEHK